MRIRPLRTDADSAADSAAADRCGCGRCEPLTQRQPNPHLSAECGPVRGRRIRIGQRQPNPSLFAAAESAICQQPNADLLAVAASAAASAESASVSCLQQPNPQLPAPAECRSVRCGRIRVSQSCICQRAAEPESVRSSRVRSCQRQQNSHLSAVAGSESVRSSAEFAPGSSSRIRICQTQPNPDLAAAAQSELVCSRIRICQRQRSADLFAAAESAAVSGSRIRVCICQRQPYPSQPNRIRLAADSCRFGCR